MSNLPFPELVWTACGIIGGYLLIENTDKLTNKGQAGVWVIFAGFMLQVYWGITHPWTSYSWWNIIYVTVCFVVGMVVYVRLMKRKKIVPASK